MEAWNDWMEEEEEEEVQGERSGEEPAGLTAGFDATTAPGRTEHGSPTLCSVCSRRHVDHTPRCIGNRGNLDTGSTPTWGRRGGGGEEN